jgi:hypothetical protein
MEEVMTKKKKTLGEKMLQANVLLTNIMKEPFQNTLKKYGYNETRWNEGHRLYEEAEEMIGNRNKAFRAQLKATRLLNKKKKEASDYFTEKAILARKALNNNPCYNKELGLSGRKKESFAGWTNDAKNFYTIAPTIPEVMSALEIFGITVESLNIGLTLIKDIEPLYSDQKDKIGMAQVTTQDRNKKTKLLFSWISDVITCARLAFKNDLQQLERLNIKVYSPSYQHQQAAGPIEKNQQADEVTINKQTADEPAKNNQQATGPICTTWNGKGGKGARLEIEEKITPLREPIISRQPDHIGGHKELPEKQNILIEFFPKWWAKGDRIKREIA